MSKYRLSGRAHSDLLDIYLFGVETFGARQAELYKRSLDDCFSLIASQPRMGRLAETIGPAIRRHEHGSHVILYTIGDEYVLILAVVHGRSMRGLEL